jgi:anti-sigma factor RsiW
MHEIVVDELERHFSARPVRGSGVERGGASRAFYDHLEGCPECRAEVAMMDEIRLCFGDLRSDAVAAPEPSLGFYNRVAGQIIEHQRKEAWGLFSPGAVFFRRIAFASLLLLAGLGSFLITRESSAHDADAAAIMAQQDTSHGANENSGRDRMLVTLATYRP